VILTAPRREKRRRSGRRTRIRGAVAGPGGEAQGVRTGQHGSFLCSKGRHDAEGRTTVWGLNRTYVSVGS